MRLASGDDTYLPIEPPKSATLRQSAFPSFVMKRPQGDSQREAEQLYSIKEEH